MINFQVLVLQYDTLTLKICLKILLVNSTHTLTCRGIALRKWESSGNHVLKLQVF